MNQAEQWVTDALRNTIPAHLPDPFQVKSAQWVMGKEKQKAIAALTMFDGKSAVVVVSKWAKFPDAWRIGWIHLEGGAFIWNGEKWIREETA